MYLFMILIFKSEKIHFKILFYVPTFKHYLRNHKTDEFHYFLTKFDASFLLYNIVKTIGVSKF